MLAEQFFLERYECTCVVPGKCVIDPEQSTLLTCGVIGLSDIANARVIDGVVMCANCDAVIYKERNRHDK